MADSRAKRLTQQTDKFVKYEPGKPIKLSNGKEIEGSTALSGNTNVHFDPNAQFGGHFIQRYNINDQLEKFHLTHEEASHLIGHLQKHSGQVGKKKPDGGSHANTVRPKKQIY